MGFDAEIGIVGAGPAGARAAELLAASGADVVMWDPRAPWEKPCGGGLTAAALKGVPELAAILPEARAFHSMRLETEHGAAVEIPLDSPLHVVPRTRLAAWQLQRARAAGAELDSTVVAEVTRLATGGWRVLLGSGRVRAVRFLVGADGATSMVRKAASPRLRIELDPTRVTLLAGAAPAPGAIVTRFFRDAAGYLWDFPRPDHRSIGVAVGPLTWTRARFDAEIDQYCRGAGSDGGEYGTRRGAVIGAALHELTPSYAEVGGRDFALLGDAAGFADPATGEGIFNALRSAELLAEAHRRTRDFSGYPRLAALAFEREFRISRRARRVLDRPALVVSVIEAAVRHRIVRALLGSMANAYNEHDPGLVRLCERIWRYARDGRPESRPSPPAASAALRIERGISPPRAWPPGPAGADVHGQR